MKYLPKYNHKSPSVAELLKDPKEHPNEEPRLESLDFCPWDSFGA